MATSLESVIEQCDVLYMTRMQKERRLTTAAAVEEAGQQLSSSSYYVLTKELLAKVCTLEEGGRVDTNFVKRRSRQ